MSKILRITFKPYKRKIDKFGSKREITEDFQHVIKVLGYSSDECDISADGTITVYIKGNIENIVSIIINAVKYYGEIEDYDISNDPFFEITYKPKELNRNREYYENLIDKIGDEYKDKINMNVKNYSPIEEYNIENDGRTKIRSYNWYESKDDTKIFKEIITKYATIEDKSPEENFDDLYDY